MLRSPTYIARPHVGADDVLSRPCARWEPLVSDELWSRVQKHMASHSRPGRYASGQYLLTGFLRCGRCDSRMGVSSTGTRRLVYRCLGGFAGANAPIPHCQHAVPLIASDRAVLDELIAVLAPLSDPRPISSVQRAWRERNGAKS